MTDVYRTGRAAAGAFVAVLVAVVVGAFVLFGSTAMAAASVPTCGGAGAAAPAPDVSGGDAAQWWAQRQLRGISGLLIAHDQVPPAVLAATDFAAGSPVLPGVCSPNEGRARGTTSVRLPGVRAPPASAA
jgi:hypothetical protein